MEMRIFLLAQKPIGHQIHGVLKEDVVGVCSNLSSNNWWGHSGITHDIFVPNDTRDDAALFQAVRQSRADVIVSVQHPWIIPNEVLGLVGLAVNVHLAPLPQYRGYYGPTHAIMNGETRYGPTVHHITSRVDAGPICADPSFCIMPDDTAWDIYQRAAALACGVFPDCLEWPTAEQDERQARYYDRDSLDREIYHPSQIDKKSRAYYFPPFEPAYIVHEGEKCHIIPGGHAWPGS